MAKRNHDNGRVMLPNSEKQPDNHLLEQLYNEYYKALVNYSMQITQDLLASEDIVHDVFTKVLELSVNVENEAGIRNYLYNGVRNLSINHLRHKGAERNYLDYVSNQHEEFHLTDNGEEDFFKEEIYRLIFKKIDELPERQREVFLMCLEGKTCREIADALSLSIDTVKTHRRRTIAKLREDLGDKGFILLLLLLSN